MYNLPSYLQSYVSPPEVSPSVDRSVPAVFLAPVDVYVAPNLTDTYALLETLYPYIIDKFDPINN